MSTHLSAKGGVRHLSVHIIKLLLGVFLFRAALDFVYVTYIGKFFASSLGGDLFVIDHIDSFRLIASYVIICVLYVCLTRFLGFHWRPSGIVLILYFSIVMVPLSSLYGLTNVSGVFFYTAAGSFILLIGTQQMLPKLKLPRPSPNIVYLGIATVLMISAYVYGWLMLTGGFERFNLRLSLVYEIRTLYKAKIGPFLGYLVPWQANVINITVLCLALHTKKRWLLVTLSIAQLLLFGMTGHKSFLLVLLLVPSIYFVWSKRNALFYIFLGATALVLGSYVLFLVTGNHLFPSLLIRRLFFVPAANHFIYYQYFIRPENPFVMLSNSIFSSFIHYPYDAPLPVVIAQEYWGHDFWPNVGYLGDAFAQFGYVGMFLFSVILGFFLRIIDSLRAHLPSGFVAAVLAPSAAALTNSALLTSLVTHGLVPAMAMVWLLGGVFRK